VGWGVYLFDECRITHDSSESALVTRVASRVTQCFTVIWQDAFLKGG